MLDTDLFNAPEEVNVEVITIQGAKPYKVAKGTTVKEIKSRYNLTGLRLIDENNNVLSDNDIITSDKQIFCSAPKRNGK